jgi:uncharacterized membrane protein
MHSFKIKTGSILPPLLISSGLGVSLYFCRVLGGHTFRYWYLLWNLGLAWLPLLFGFLLIRYVQKGRWISPKGIVLTALWLGFLPNSFYLVTDFIHLTPTNEVGILFDAVMIMVFAWNGLLLGFISVYMIHAELRQRLQQRLTLMIIGFIFVICSFAIYLGRYLTWNTWDVIINPGGILFDISDRIVRPRSYPNTFTTTTLFSVVLIVLYYTVYKLVAAIRSSNHSRY